ncbi:response regulator transcription factor [Nocardiopsis suaedae]|uniref:Response regulator transcription factor n=1 Tax=Nocardiopsis suaedae TaxID=3018444 RepID=A0ABT4TJ75_9ACTN|nr:response regulator transcription factor [Nocardiopsis suaedae]MDA2804727.1 response regulator transcription factor [Nocardiopsis suaedae]
MTATGAKTGSGAGPQEALTVVVADDSVLLREGVSGVLERFGHRVVAAVGDADALEEAVRGHDPDLVVTDVRMPPGYADEGLLAAVRIRRERPAVGIIVLSQYVQPAYAAELLAIDAPGGAGYLLKERIGDVEEFAGAVAKAAAGGTVLDREVVQVMMAARSSPLDRLAPREREVLGLMARGESNAAIARLLVVSDAAVRKHVGSIFTKLDLDPRMDGHRRVLAVLAYLDR